MLGLRLIDVNKMDPWYQHWIDIGIVSKSYQKEDAIVELETLLDLQYRNVWGVAQNNIIHFKIWDVMDIHVYFANGFMDNLETKNYFLFIYDRSTLIDPLGESQHYQQPISW